MTRFDSFAEDYDAALNRGLAVSGEGKTYFAQGRIVWLSRCLRQLDLSPQSVLDYGCGTGTATPLFVDILKAQSVVGVDVSARSLEVARRTHGGPAVEYALISDYAPRATNDLAFCNGVFHHIAPIDRLDALRYIAGCLRPGGIFALWENNPWNPGARYVMSKIPFDKDAVMLSARSAAALAKAAGLRPVRCDYCFVFPHALRWCRRLEPLLSRIPLGAQYQLLLRK